MLASLAAVTLAVAATAGDPTRVPVLRSPVTLDGASDEEAWSGVPALPVMAFQPEWGSEPSERTEILVAHDGEALYVTGRLFDREPGRIGARSRKRDSDDASSDWFGVVVDSFDDRQTALAFFTTPTGLRWDCAVLNDAQPPRPQNVSWNGFWDVVVRRDERGWFAEMRIPFSTLGSQPREGEVVMGFIGWRSIARRNEWIVFPRVSPDFGFWGLFKPSQSQRLQLSGVRGQRALRFAPYALGGAEAVGGAGRQLESRAGLDLKYGVTSNLTLDATVNTDFAQVEADEQQVNLTRFPLFYPETRTFFQERASSFDFDFDGSNRLFYSRRIGLVDGEPVTVRGGGRLVGRAGAWDLAVLHLHTGEGRAPAAEAFTVARVRRTVLNRQSTLGAVLASRRGDADNLNGGLDGDFRWGSDDQLTVRLAATLEDERRSAWRGRPEDASRVFLRLQRPTIRRASWDLSYSRSGAGYDPGVGFEARPDSSRVAASVGWGWAPTATSSLLNHRASLEGTVYRRNRDGGLESADGAVRWSFESKKGTSGSFEAHLQVEDLVEPFVLSPSAVVPTGRHSFAAARAALSTPGGRAARVVGSVAAGTWYDGTRVSAQVGADLRAGADLSLAAEYRVDHAAFAARDQSFTAHVGRLRALWTWTTRLSASSFVQVNSALDSLVANVRLRYNPREGVDVYLVYDETLPFGRTSSEVRRGRTAAVKLTYTFALRG
jgi:hypothetical protein